MNSCCSWTNPFTRRIAWSQRGGAPHGGSWSKALVAALVVWPRDDMDLEAVACGCAGVPRRAPGHGHAGVISPTFGHSRLELCPPPRLAAPSMGTVLQPSVSGICAARECVGNRKRMLEAGPCRHLRNQPRTGGGDPQCRGRVVRSVGTRKQSGCAAEVRGRFGVLVRRFPHPERTSVVCWRHLSRTGLSRGPMPLVVVVPRCGRDGAKAVPTTEAALHALGRSVERRIARPGHGGAETLPFCPGLRSPRSHCRGFGLVAARRLFLERHAPSSSFQRGGALVLGGTTN